MAADPRVIRALAPVDPDEVADELATLPDVNSWPELDDAERERRRQTLEAIAKHIKAHGPHVAYPSPVRGRQFMPFAALEGYKEMLEEVEREVNESE